MIRERPPREVPDYKNNQEGMEYRNNGSSNKIQDDKYTYRDKKDQNYVKPENPREKPDQSMNKNSDPREVPDYDLEPGLDPRDLPDQSLINGGDPRELPEQSLVEEEPERNLPEQSLNGQDNPRELPNQAMTLEDPARDLPDLPLTEEDPARELPNPELYGQDEPRDVPEPALDAPELHREVPDYNLIQNDSERILPALELTREGEYREVPDQGFSGSEGFREIPTGITFGTEDGRVFNLYQINEHLDPGRELPSSIILEKGELINEISKATSGSSQNFKNINQMFLDAERSIKDLIADGDGIYEAYKDAEDNRKAVLDALKDFQTDAQKDNYADRIKALQAALKQLTEIAARSLPDIPLTGATFKNEQDINKNFSLVPTEAVRRIYNNMLLFGLDAKEIQRFSYQSLYGLDRELVRAIADSEALISVLQPSVFSKATSPDNKIKDGTLTDPPRKTKTGKKLLG